MRPVSDEFLLNMAEVSVGLVGLFLVGVFFYVETAFRRPAVARDVVERYFKASTRIVLILYAIPIWLSLTLVVLEPIWSSVFFAILGLALRYVEWTSDPDPADATYVADFAYLPRQEGQPVRCMYDRHVCGLFGRATWLQLLEEVGFHAEDWSAK